MARKGDIDSKSVASRVPMEVYLRLLKSSSSNGMTLSSYLCDVLSKDNFSQGGQTKIEYQDRVIEKKIEVPIYRDRIIEKKVEIDNPKIIQENVALKKQIELLELEIKKLTPKKYTTSPTKNQEECHPDYEWFFSEETGEWVSLGSFEERAKKFNERTKRR
jgi:hypothetical protein